MNDQWLDELKRRLEVEATQANNPSFERLQHLGMIDEKGEVTGKLRRWDAHLAITEVKHDVDRRQILMFRCLKPVFGMPGGATIEIRRQSMVDDLSNGKKVVTAIRDDRLGIWKEGCAVRLSSSGSIRCDQSDDAEDNVGNLPEFQQSNSRF